MERQNLRNGFFGLWRNMKLKSKLLFSITLLIILITVTVLIAVDRVIMNNMLKNKQAMLDHTITSVENLIEERRTTLEQYVSLIKMNANFIDAINISLFTGEFEEINEQSISLQNEIRQARRPQPAVMRS